MKVHSEQSCKLVHFSHIYRQSLLKKLLDFVCLVFQLRPHEYLAGNIVTAVPSSAYGAAYTGFKKTAPVPAPAAGFSTVSP